MRQLSIGPRMLICLLIALLLLADTAVAQQTDSNLQARLVQRSDGSVYVYKDGGRYLIQPADLSDDDIDAIPLAGSIDRLDQLFAQTAPAGVQAPTPTPDNPALPQPGTLLYQVDWAAGANGWALPADWQIANGLLSDTGTLTDVSIIASPYEPPSADYAVEADIQALKYTPIRCCTSNGFGVFSRGDNRNQYQGGMLDAGQTAGIAAPAMTTAARAFNSGTAWHTYRLETKANKFRLLIDGVLWTEGPTPNTTYTPSGRITGLWSTGAQINVRSFRIIAL